MGSIVIVSTKNCSYWVNYAHFLLLKICMQTIKTIKFQIFFCWNFLVKHFTIPTMCMSNLFRPMYIYIEQI